MPHFTEQFATSPLQNIQHPLLKKHQVRLSVKRDDLLHPLVNGNKLRKLKYNLLAAKQQGKDHLVTFGGAFSNHIHATAAAAKLAGFRATGFIRTHKLDANNPTLKFAQSCGMTLIPLSREVYRLKHTQAVIQSCTKEIENPYVIPEGGSNALALQGMAELIEELPPCDYIYTPIASSGSFAGLLKGAQKHQHPAKLIAVAVLKGAEFIQDDILRLFPDAAILTERYHLSLSHHFGGYGKFTLELVAFCRTMKQHGLPLEPIYSGKMMAGLFADISAGHIPAGSHIVAVHTGGLQGIQGLRYRGLLNAHDL